MLYFIIFFAVSICVLCFGIGNMVASISAMKSDKKLAEAIGNDAVAFDVLISDFKRIIAAYIFTFVIITFCFVCSLIEYKQKEMNNLMKDKYKIETIVKNTEKDGMVQSDTTYRFHRIKE